MGFDYEPEFEDALIKLLKNNGWSGKMLNYPTEEQLIKNWADILFNNNNRHHLYFLICSKSFCT